MVEVFKSPPHNCHESPVDYETGVRINCIYLVIFNKILLFMFKFYPLR